jgi:hypothetical protein
MNSIELAYVKGFTQKCSEVGVNPAELAKFAVQVGPAGGQLMAPAPTQPQLAAFKGKARPQAPGVQPMPSAPTAEVKIPAVPTAGSQSLKRQLME